MRALVFGLLLATSAWAQTELPLLASASTAEPEFSSSRSVSIAPLIKPVPSIDSRQIQTSEPRKLNTRAWYLLTATSHGAAAFDAWTTRRNISSGMVELNPMLKPFANSNAIYPALQVGPTVTTYLSRRMMRSDRSLFRKLWWTPQVASTAISLTCGVMNVKRH
jgi:hypothetical protein